ncbi:hypothetical protein HYQ46_000363 [Verticillium longisporum]|nr:hypothetical protein HYQ46_000363 [Verticillium longisporum]
MQAHIVDNTQVETPSDLIKQHTDRFHGQENETRLLGLVNPLAWASPVMVRLRSFAGSPALGILVIPTGSS